MATIGNSLSPYFTATTSDVFSANGTGTDFTLTRSISNLVDIEVLVNNIQQNPFNGAYSVNGNTLTFSEAPSAGANNVLVNYRQAVIGSTIPTPNTVASASLQRDLTLGGNTTSNGTMFTQALVPTANVTYDIGTSTLRYKDIYLSGSTINLGDVSLSASGNTFTVANSTGGTLPSSMGNTTIVGTANVTGDMTIGGNLTVTGTMTYINTTDLNIGDAIISLNADLGSGIAPTEDAGININRGASTNAQFKWIESTDNWSLGNTTVSGILTSNDHVITGTANVSTGINVGANVNLSTSQINVGNATVNTVITSTSLTTTSNTATFGNTFYVAANGNIGVGTSSPTIKLDLSTSAFPAARFKSTYTAASKTYSSVVIGDAVSGNGAQFGWVFDSANTTNSFAHITPYGQGEGNYFKIDTSGNVGIGVTAPSATLHVSTGNALLATFASSRASGSYIQYSLGGSGTTIGYLGSAGQISLTGGTNDLSLRAENNLIFNAGGNTERLRIDTRGNMGLGVVPNANMTSNLKFLQFADVGYIGNFASGTNQQIWFGLNNFYDTGWKYIQSGTGAGLYRISGGLHEWFAAPSGTANNVAFSSASMTLDTSGNLGLGVTAPQNKLQVVTTTRPQFSVSYNGTTGLYLEDGTNSSWKSWKLSTSFGNGSDLSFVQSTNTSGTPTWAATAAMTLDASGNVGIGTSSPSARLTVNGAAGAVALKLTNAAVDGNIANVLEIEPSNGAYYGKLIKVTSGRSDFSDSLLFLNTTSGMNSVNGSYLRVQNSANSDIFRISGAGTVIIGSLSSTANGSLHISNASAGSVYTGLYIQNTDNSSSGQGSQIVFRNSYTDASSETTKHAYIRYSAASNYGEQGILEFGTNNAYNTAPTTRLKINTSGNVEVFNQLEFISTSYGTAQISNINATNVASGGTVDFANFSGMIIVNNWNQGSIGVWIAGGGTYSLVSSVSTYYYGSLSYTAGVYRWTSNAPTTHTYTFTAIRTRSNA